MRATGINHVSIHAPDLEASVHFYTEVFGMERIPAFTFATPVAWLRLGDLQLHLFQRDIPYPTYHHIGITVDDFTSVYLKAKQLGILDESVFGSAAFELPDGAVQMYLRDPAGNLVEVDWPDVGSLDRSVFADLSKLADVIPQTREATHARLFLAGRERELAR